MSSETKQATSTENPIPTDCAPAERLDPWEMLEQCQTFTNRTQVKWLLNSLPDMTVVLNQHRQIVSINDAMLLFLGLKSEEEAFGKRPGEVLGCLHSVTLPGGCGTSKHCTQCGAMSAIFEIQHTHQKSVRECQIVRQKGESLDFRVHTAPYIENDDPFILFTLVDISNEKRRNALERIFFHDIRNTAGGIVGLSKLLSDPCPDLDQSHLFHTMTDMGCILLDEIDAQQQLLQAENDEIAISKKPITIREILHSLRKVYQLHEAGTQRTISIENESPLSEINTDAGILLRVLGNMLKNALEATQAGGYVDIGVRKNHCGIEFWVHNNEVMSESTRLQVFKRSFSTKGRGRGLGTYSMKLLGERYLKGKVSFVSTKATGTVFSLELPLSEI